MPVRIQRKRTKGYKLPPNAVYVGRPTKWGNPYLVQPLSGMTRQDAVQAYLHHINGNLWTSPNKQEIRDELRGKDLACWCPLDQPCHADVLLEIANK